MARGGRGGGSRNPANQPREVQVSRKVSWLLRHGASQEGLKLGKGGYVNVQEVVSLLPINVLRSLMYAQPEGMTICKFMVTFANSKNHI